ncbi:MAG: cupin domain-containing protein [Geodermatophilaceae bacterium]|jgi:mannose-6-phosphate isomerase-like protein (cupin superfamily)|nr:cupin domain-containing protein [Geodermatophilaceae bacterium]
MPVATLSEAPEFVLGDAVFRALAVPSRGSTQFAIWALELAPGMSGEAHSLDCEEVLVIHSGRISATIGMQEIQAGPGDAVIVPMQTSFALRNAGPEAVHATAITSAGFLATLGDRTMTPPWSL